MDTLKEKTFTTGTENSQSEGNTKPFNPLKDKE
jgi:hypothetical protein